MIRRWLACAFVSFVTGEALRAAEPKPPSPESVEFFEKSIRPILVENCAGCHGPKKQQAGLRLDTAAGLAKGADGAAVVEIGRAHV